MPERPPKEERPKNDRPEVPPPRPDEIPLDLTKSTKESDAEEGKEFLLPPPPPPKEHKTEGNP